MIRRRAALDGWVTRESCILKGELEFKDRRGMLSGWSSVDRGSQGWESGEECGQSTRCMFMRTGREKARGP